MISESLYSSKSDEWYTPDNVYNELDAEFNFNLDPCATKENHKCPMFYTKEENGLNFSWGGRGYFAIHHTVKYQNG